MTPQPAITITTLFITLTLFACTSIDRGSFGEFTRSLNNTDYGYKVGKDPTHDAPTELIEVFQVNPGDCGESTGWSDCANDRERSELSEKVKDNYPGSEHWYGWSIYFPNDFPNVFPTKTALGQFHQDKSHPVWMFQNADGGYHLDDQVRGTTRRYYSLIDEVDLRGQWHKIEVHVRWEKMTTDFSRFGSTETTRLTTEDRLWTPIVFISNMASTGHFFLASKTNTTKMRCLARSHTSRTLKGRIRGQNFHLSLVNFRRPNQRSMACSTHACDRNIRAYQFWLYNHF